MGSGRLRMLIINQPVLAIMIGIGVLELVRRAAIYLDPVAWGIVIRIAVPIVVLTVSAYLFTGRLPDLLDTLDWTQELLDSATRSLGNVF